MYYYIAYQDFPQFKCFGMFRVRDRSRFCRYSALRYRFGNLENHAAFLCLNEHGYKKIKDFGIQYLTKRAFWDILATEPYIRLY